MEKYIIGIDEAGRGPLAGPVTAAAVILPRDFPIEILNDSKKLSEKKRLAAELLIKEKAVTWKVAWASPKTIDTINILQASLLAMQRAFYGLKNIPYNRCTVLVDGNMLPELPCPAEAIIKGDSLIPEIMAASILAKCARDRWMEKAAEIYPEWNFEKHKGYPTALHRQRCREYGLTPIHRISFKIFSS